MEKEDFECGSIRSIDRDIDGFVIYDPVNADVYELVEECYKNTRPVYKKSVYGEKIFAYIEL